MKIAGLNGSERLGRLVQSTDPITHDACTFVHLKKQKGTVGNLTLTFKATPNSTVDVPVPESVVTSEDVAFDLSTSDVTTAPKVFAAADVASLDVTAAVDGQAYQGKKHSERHSHVRKATEAEKHAAKKKYSTEVKAAKKSNKHNEKKLKAAVKKAKVKYDKARSDKKTTKTTVVADKTPFESSVSLGEFVLLDAVASADDDNDDTENETEIPSAA